MSHQTNQVAHYCDIHPCSNSGDVPVVRRTMTMKACSVDCWCNHRTMDSNGTWEETAVRRYSWMCLEGLSKVTEYLSQYSPCRVELPSRSLEPWTPSVLSALPIRKHWVHSQSTLIIRTTWFNIQKLFFSSQNVYWFVMIFVTNSECFRKQR
jgi:hypothetical protein